MLRIFWGFIATAALVTGGMVWQQRQPAPDSDADTDPQPQPVVQPTPREPKPTVTTQDTPAPEPDTVGQPSTEDTSTEDESTGDTSLAETNDDATADPTDMTAGPDPLADAVAEVFAPIETEPGASDPSQPDLTDPIVEAAADALGQPETDPTLEDIANTTEVGSDTPLVGQPINSGDVLGELLANNTSSEREPTEFEDPGVANDDAEDANPEDEELATFPDLASNTESNPDANVADPASGLDELANELLNDATSAIEDATTEKPAPVTAPSEGTGEMTMVAQEDGSFLVNDRFVIRGEGTKDSPYVISWDLLTSAQETYRPREQMTDLPSWVELLNGKVVRLTGFMAIPIWAESTDEMLLMLNEWDGCCIGVPPTPYDAIEVKLAKEIGLETQRYSYGNVTGTFKVDPYIANNWLIGLYVIEDGAAAIN